MTKGKEKLELSVRMHTSLSNEHAGLLSFIEELEPYVSKNPDDKWAAGQLKYSRKRCDDLAKCLGLASNRKPRSI